jgi:YNFM family putative membrane transporter
MRNSNDKLSLLFLATAALLVVSQLYIPIPIIDVFSHIFSIPLDRAVWVGSAFSFSYAGGFLIFGPMSDRYGRKAILIPGLFLLGIVSLLLSRASTFQYVLLGRVLQGFFAATFAPAALAYIGENFIPSRRPTGIALVSTGFMAAAVLGQLFASTINIHFGWSAIFTFSGIAYLFYGVFALFLLKEEKKNVENKKKITLKDFYISMVHHLKNRKLLAIYFCAFVLLLSFVAMYSGLFPYLIKNYHLKSADLFNIRAIGLIGVCFAPFSGTFIRWLGIENLLILSLLMIVLSVLIEAYIPIYNVILLGSVSFVAGVSLVAPCLISLVNLNATKAKGAAVSLYTFILFIGAGIGPIFSSAMHAYSFQSLSLAITSIIIISIIIILSNFNSVFRRKACI